MPSNIRSSILGDGDDVFFGFAPSCRLKKGWEFDAVFRTGRQQRGELVRLYFLRISRPSGQPARVGVTVGKRIANAVGRVHGRRMLREAFRRLLPWIKEDLWIVASLREVALTANARAVYCDMAGALVRAHLMKDKWPGAEWTVDCPVSCSSLRR